MVDQEDLEALADAVYQLAGYDADGLASPATLAVRVLGKGALIVVPHLIEQGHLATVKGRKRIAVRRGLPDEARDHVIGHELGHWILERSGVPVDDETEQACDFIGAALIVPRRPFRSAVRVHSDDWTQLALDFGTTETMVALRYGEVVGTPLAVVAKVVRVRGGAYAWPETTEQIRRLAKMPAFPGMKRARLRDDPRRVVLEAEEVWEEIG